MGQPIDERGDAGVEEGASRTKISECCASEFTRDSVLGSEDVRLGYVLILVLFF